MALDAFLSQSIIVYAAVFARVGAMFMTLPALGEQTISSRARLSAALVVSAVLAPLLGGLFPPADAPLFVIVGLIAGEVLIGVFFGLAIRILMSALNVAGQSISMQASLAMAQSFDPTQQIQGALIGSFLMLLGVTMIFATDMHHMMLAAMRDSYALFVPGTLPNLEDAASLIVGTMAKAFLLGVQLASPFIVVGLMIYAGLGFLAKLMPQLQVFFVAMPINIMVGLSLLFILLGALMTAFLGAFEELLAAFLA